MGDRLFDKRVDNYFRTENVVLEREDLTIYEKMVYIVLCRYANNNDGAFPSYNTIAKNASICRDKAIKTVKTLEIKKLVEKETRYKSNSKENTSNIYYVLSAEPEVVVNNDHLVVNSDYPLVVNNYYPSSQQLPKEELLNKNYSFNKNYTHRDLKILCVEIQNILGEKLTQKTVQGLINGSSLEVVRGYMTNWGKYKPFAKTTQSAYFIHCIQNNITVPTTQATTYTNKVPQYQDFEQREYKEEDLQRFYANLNS